MLRSIRTAWRRSSGTRAMADDVLTLRPVPAGDERRRRHDVPGADPAGPERRDVCRSRPAGVMRAPPCGRPGRAPCSRQPCQASPRGPAAPPAWAEGAALGTALGVGLLFGLWPAPLVNVMHATVENLVVQVSACKLPALEEGDCILPRPAAVAAAHP